MASQAAARIIQSKNSRSIPLNLLRGSNSGVTRNINVETNIIPDPRLLQQKPISAQYFTMDPSTANGSFKSVLDWRFGGSGEMGRVEARGKKVEIDDDEFDDDDDDAAYDIEDIADGEDDDDDDYYGGSDSDREFDEEDDIAEVKKRYK